VDAPNGIALGHRRLAVIDLTDAGSQPMHSSSGRYILTYNGEIYNAREIRQRLAVLGCEFRGHSDTEVLLAAIDHWGFEQALSQTNGMFALAVWDRQACQLQLARDRIGEKPLYYGWVGETFVFGSELKAICSYPGFSPQVDRGALALYFRHNCVPAPYCIYERLAKLPPGTFLTIKAGTKTTVPQPRPYWSARHVAERGSENMSPASACELADELDLLLTNAVALRMEADVPLGAFLSGGVDSSTVVALMQAQSSRKIKTFTIGFEDKSYDESDQAARVAAHLGTDHTGISLTPAAAMEIIPRLPELYDEPFSDSSQIPTFLVSRLARTEVTVALSGDGGDELFGGYTRYAWSTSIWRWLRRVPRPVRLAVAAAMRRPSVETWDSLFRGAAPILPNRMKVRYPGIAVKKLASILPSHGIADIYNTLTSHFNDPLNVVLGACEPSTLLTNLSVQPDLSDPIARMMYTDLVTYLPDDILVKLDRASMGVSLEARVPMLDHRLVEFAWQVPMHIKLRAGEGKWLLRQVLHRYVPPSLVEGPKSGFGLPISDWLCGPLREWAENLLEPTRLRQQGLLNPITVRGIWETHLKGDRLMAYKLWDILMFQSWLESSPNC